VWEREAINYCLLLGDGDINDRGEGDEGSLFKRPQ